MSVAFAPHRPRGKGDITPAGIQKLLDENNHLIQCIMDFQSKGKTAECSQYQQMLHRNLVYLATIADSNQNMQSLLPAPPTQNIPMPGGMNQSGPPQQPPHGHSMPSDGPAAPHMQAQMNGQMAGPNHMPMQGPGPNQPPNMQSGSINMPPNSHGSMGGYNHAVSSSQGIPAQGQMNMSQSQPMGNYGPRPNMNMQPNQGPMMHQQPPSQQYSMPPGGGGQHYQGQQNPMGMMGQVNQGNHVMGQRPMPPYRPPQQGPPQQYPGQEEYYGEQYNHGGQGAPEGSAQYGQQQEPYQQGPPQQQGYPPQQQYPGQQAYPGQQQGYGPSQGAPGQYPNYPQGQGQQYGAYRAPQPGPPQTQQQRPYGYEQAHMRK
ncbi:protein SSXT isoform X2 [Denticeps clupeoides]|uniref:SS18 N-terminal domain-containing protein n=1 Tax=Denticeps clupeoides TaxID=299321 RepID=A0AAY4CUF8_9TELE|nr:protein SSXT isoform X2 [Denticeps clupeoides]XP_028832764.1 protein SSXT isoform X2 [Denticeps clupeoides]